MTTNNIREEILGEFDELWNYATKTEIRNLILSSLDKYANAKLEEAVWEIEKLNKDYRKDYSQWNEEMRILKATEERAHNQCLDTAISIINNLKTK